MGAGYTAMSPCAAHHRELFLIFFYYSFHHLSEAVIERKEPILRMYIFTTVHFCLSWLPSEVSYK